MGDALLSLLDTYPIGVSNEIQVFNTGKLFVQVGLSGTKPMDRLASMGLRRVSKPLTVIVP